ncbi:glycoside hydrolase family 55 protein [Paraburkholderia sp. CNPSo 3274]|uniref:glycoside hydrolase family 55 protein n=1 Tax=Paraburkholderia sp. CNPSo 3274 TaxID=2940932 RepID=UPI0020B894E7|nr:glycoside hydrolase family 55 protein [Paraburkholderia sp. CNPSo 3274]MCP3709721.1 glycoside hydrolase family 55 protein [Paraburkholderia sp. CNPSo 3274]
MSALLSPTPVMRFYDNNNNPLAGGQLYTYQAGTTTPTTTYTDATAGTPNSNPIILNARGEAPVWLSPVQAYKFVLEDANGNTIWTADQITSPAPVAVGNMTDEKGSGGQIGFVNGVDFTAGTSLTLTLSQNYGSSSNLWVAFDAAEQGGDTFSLGGANNETLTFNAPIPVGTQKVYVKGGTSLSVGTPGAGAVTDASVAAGAGIQSSKLSYNEGGAGALTRTVQSRLQDFVTVKDFGATGNGSTDDTAAIQAAITAVGNAGGGTVYFPPGTYKISSLTVPTTGVFLLGAGKNATNLAPSSLTATFLTFSGAQSQGISGMSITWSSATPPLAGAAIYVNNVQNFTLRDVEIYGALTALSIYQGATHYYDNLTIWNLVPTNGVGIYINQGNDRYFKNILINTSLGSGNQPFAGVRINHSDGEWFDSSDLLQCGIGMLIDPQASTDHVQFLFCTQVGMDTCSANGLVIAPNNAVAEANSLHFIDCWTGTCTNDGVAIGGIGVVDGVRFIGHRSYHNNAIGFDIGLGTGTVTHIYLADCAVAGNSQASYGAHPGIAIESGVSGWSVQGGMVGGGDGFPVSQSVGILVVPGASDAYSIIGVDVRNNSVAGIQDNGTGTHKFISKNVGYNPIAGTGITVGASPFVWTNNTGDTVTLITAGGSVSNITMGGLAVATSTNNSVAVPQGQAITVTYSSTPTMSYYGH